MVKRKKKFGISTQHYSFAVKSFVELVKWYDTQEYEFVIRETKTKEVIEDVHTGKSEIGTLYMSNFNRKALINLLKASDLIFHKLIICDAYVYLWKGHPLAREKRLIWSWLRPIHVSPLNRAARVLFTMQKKFTARQNIPAPSRPMTAPPCSTWWWVWTDTPFAQASSVRN